MSGGQGNYGSSAWWVRQVTDDVTVELWRGDGPHIRLVATSYPIRLALAELGALSGAIQDAIEAFDQAVDTELDTKGPLIDLASGPVEVVIDPDGVVIDLTDGPAKEAIEQDGMPIDVMGAPAKVVIEPDGGVVNAEEGLECDICGRRAIVVVDDSEHTTLCDECYDGYYREKPSWSVEQYLEHQGRELDDSTDTQG